MNKNIKTTLNIFQLSRMKKSRKYYLRHNSGVRILYVISKIMNKLFVFICF